jgi:D-beta-D-heptose 7-phosphate kinase/D-beta-D-heptose 1-phosphate adenosyltransferase
MDFRGKKILVVGDVMLDRYVYGRVERISPEAPVPVLSIEREEVMLGGAGNVVRNLSALGANTIFISVVDKDPEGYEITGLIGNTKGCEAHLIYERRGTTVKTRYVSGQQIVRADRDCTHPLSLKGKQDIVNFATSCLSECDAVIISDYGKGTIDHVTAPPIIKASKGKPIIVDPKNPNWSIYSGCTVITPNENEFYNIRDDTSFCDGDYVLKTNGKNGMDLWHTYEVGGGIGHDQMTKVHIPAIAKEVFDVSGAGDTVVAVLALGLASEMDMLDAAKLANKAAGIVVGKRGTATVSMEELER